MFRIKLILFFFTLSFALNAVTEDSLNFKQKRYVILKLDDVVGGPKGQAMPERWVRVTDFIREKGIKAAFGIIGYSLVKDNPDYFQWIRGLNKDGFIEFWNHGFRQRKSQDPQGEFELDYESQLHSLLLTDSLAKEKLGITLNAWGPHWSGTNGYTDRALSQISSIKIAFGYPPRHNHFEGIVLPRLIDIEYPTHNPDYKRFLSAYNKLKSVPFLSFLQGHPNSWDEERWAEFVKIIDFLISEGVEFATPSEYIDYIKN